MKFAVLFLILVTAVVAANAQKATADPDGPKLKYSPDAVFADEGIALGLGGMIRVLVDVDAAGKPTVIRANGPAAPCANFDDARIAALRDAAIAAAENAVFEPSAKAARTYLQFQVPYPPLSDDEKGKPKYISGGILNGKATSLPRPEYPASASGTGAKGGVTIMVTVDTDGNVIGAAGIGGDPRLFEAASTAACRAKFTPTRLAGNPIQVFGFIAYNFVP